MGFVVEGIDHVALAVGDQRASEEWYREVLGLRRAFADEWGDTPVVVTSDSGGMALFKALAVPGPLVRLEFQDHGAAHSIYFEDPDGLKLELTTYDI